MAPTELRKGLALLHQQSTLLAQTHARVACHMSHVRQLFDAAPKPQAPLPPLIGSTEAPVLITIYIRGHGGD